MNSKSGRSMSRLVMAQAGSVAFGGIAQLPFGDDAFKASAKLEPCMLPMKSRTLEYISRGNTFVLKVVNLYGTGPPNTA